MDRPTRLTAAFVKNIEEKGRYGDGRGGFGLSLLVRPVKSGLSKTYQQKVRIRGRDRMLGIGSVDKISLADARRIAAVRVNELRARYPEPTGFDRLKAELEGAEPAPVAAAPVALTIPTFAELVEITFDRKRGAWKAAKTERNLRGQLERYIFPTLGDTRIDQIDGHDLTGLLAESWHEKPQAAKKLLQFLRAAFNVAWADGHREDNPIERVKVGLGKQNTVTEHHYAIPYTTVGATLSRLRESSAYPAKRAALEFLVLTGARAGEATGARWGEIDLDERMWTIPAERTKSKRMHAVPLSDAARKVLWQLVGRRIHLLIPPDAFVFPNSAGKRPVMPDVLRPLIRAAADDDQATVHGLRSTFRDWAAEQTDYPAEIAEHALAHIEGSATERAYRRTDYFEKRRGLMQAWADYVKA